MKNRLHTAEHILFSVLDNKFNIKTRAMQLTEDSCRVVYDAYDNLREFKDDIENKVNEIVNKNLDVRFFEVSRSEATKLVDVSLIPGSIDKVKIYEIVGFNKLACSGPHVKNTSEIGKFKILSIKKKGRNCFSINFTLI